MKKLGELLMHILSVTSGMINKNVFFPFTYKRNSQTNTIYIYINNLTILFLTDNGGYCQHFMSIYSFPKSWVHWSLDCSDYLHESSNICWLLEVSFLFSCKKRKRFPLFLFRITYILHANRYKVTLQVRKIFHHISIQAYPFL